VRLEPVYHQYLRVSVQSFLAAIGETGTIGALMGIGEWAPSAVSVDSVVLVSGLQAQSVFLDPYIA
jgi:hypothetical protein